MLYKFDRFASGRFILFSLFSFLYFFCIAFSALNICNDNDSSNEYLAAGKASLIFILYFSFWPFFEQAQTKPLLWNTSDSSSTFFFVFVFFNTFLHTLSSRSNLFSFFFFNFWMELLFAFPRAIVDSGHVATWPHLVFVPIYHLNNVPIARP